MARTSSFLRFLRWLAVFPASVVAALLGTLAVFGLSKIFFRARGGIGGGIILIWWHFWGSAVVGVAGVYFGQLVSPSHNGHVAIVLAGLALLGSSTISVGAFYNNGWMGVFDLLCLNAGSIGTAYLLTKGTTTVGKAVFFWIGICLAVVAVGVTLSWLLGMLLNPM